MDLLAEQDLHETYISDLPRNLKHGCFFPIAAGRSCCRVLSIDLGLCARSLLLFVRC